MGYAGGGASLDTTAVYCSVLREHFLVRAQLSISVEVRMPPTRLAACLASLNTLRQMAVTDQVLAAG